MRSLRTDIGIVENTLSKLQKVGDELAADFGNRTSRAARNLSTGKTDVT